MNEPAWGVRLASAARRDIKRLDPPVRERIVTALEGLRAQPPTGDIKRLAGEPPEWRLRVGDWRVRDPDLAEVVPQDRRDQAVEDCTAPELRFTVGAWSNDVPIAPDAIGFVVLEGILLRRVAIDGRFAVELLGECDLLRPWQLDDAQTLPLTAQWAVLEPVRLALLDVSFTRQISRYPELAGRLFERAVRRSRRLVVNMAIIHQARVDDRLHLLFWHFAGRWGRVRGDGVRGDGVLLPVRLTHTVLADLVAARRPTVTSALSELSRRGVVRLIDVEIGVTGSLIIGSVPAVLVGSLLSSTVPDRFVRPAIAFVIFASGLKYVGVGTTALGWILCVVLLGSGLLWMAYSRPLEAQTKRAAEERGKSSQPAPEVAAADAVSSGSRR